MTVVRRIARPLLAGVFVSGGIDTLRNPPPRVEKAGRAGVGELPFGDPEQLTKINAGVQVGAGLLLATNRLPRLAALALAGSLVPTTYAGHPFWAEKDKAARKGQQIHFFKNLAILGGLLTAAVDTGGRESVPHRAKRAVADATDRGAATSRKARKASAKARAKAAKQASKQASKVSGRLGR